MSDWLSISFIETLVVLLSATTQMPFSSTSLPINYIGLLMLLCGSGGSVGTAIGYVLDGLGIESR